jgi:NhaP-type Na+/H+ or K+/H+ antiporter
MDLQNPALTIGLAMGAGVLAQALARHLLIPGIVLLLATGVLLGPDVGGLIRPDVLGPALRMLVGFAVAVILFEGGMSLDIERLRGEALVIRRLVTVGAVITAVGGALAVRLLMGWDWGLAILFGTLVIVTGPTVVTPLVRRLRLREPVSTILEAEGVLIDPIGALIAVVALEVLYATETTVASGFGTWATVLGSGALMGLIGGFILVVLLRPRGVVPAGLENIMVLSLVMALFQISEAFRHESGLTAVVVAGMVVGNVRTRVSRELLDFKEQLTVLMIGLLFVLLAADVRLRDVVDLGWPAVLTVLALMLVVRPVQVALCSIGSRLSWQERAFLATMAPRGIVAAAVASLFAQQMAERGLTHGNEFRALVFLVIAITVTVHGLTGGVVAAWLHMRKPSGNGYIFLGGNALARALGHILKDDGQEVQIVDSNVDRAITSRAEGFSVLHGQGLQPATLEQADPDSRVGCVAITPNEEVNLLFAARVREETRVPALFVALQREHGGIPVDSVHRAGASVLFGRSRRLDEWTARLESGDARVERWTRNTAAPADMGEALHELDSLLVIAVRRRGRMRPFDDETQLGAREEIAVVVDKARLSAAGDALRARNWTPADSTPAPVTA